LFMQEYWEKSMTLTFTIRARFLSPPSSNPGQKKWKSGVPGPMSPPPPSSSSTSLGPSAKQTASRNKRSEMTSEVKRLDNARFQGEAERAA
jgi:hypothetical protein